MSAPLPYLTRSILLLLVFLLARTDSANIKSASGNRTIRQAYPSFNSSVSKNVSVKIYGGYEATPNAWPWMVGLYYLSKVGSYRRVGSRPYCGGSLIFNRYVLTAAHCVIPSDSVKAAQVPRNQWIKVSTYLKHQILLRFGDHNVDYEGEFYEQDIEASMVFLFTQIESAYNEDLALVLLARPVEITHAVQTIVMASHYEHVPVGATCTAIGWGNTNRKPSNGASVLQQVDVTIRPPLRCSSILHPFDSLRHICFGDGSTHSLYGDSGSGLFCRVKNGLWKLFGVISYGWETGPSVAIYVGRYSVSVTREVLLKNHLEWLEATEPAFLAPPSS